MKKWYDYLTDAKQIDELNNSMSELARSEHKELSDYSQGEYVATAKNLFDIMEDWEGQCDGRKLRKQRRLLKEYIEKYEIKNPEESINEWLKQTMS